MPLCHRAAAAGAPSIVPAVEVALVRRQQQLGQRKLSAQVSAGPELPQRPAPLVPGAVALRVAPQCALNQPQLVSCARAGGREARAVALACSAKCVPSSCLSHATAASSPSCAHAAARRRATASRRRLHAVSTSGLSSSRRADRASASVPGSPPARAASTAACSCAYSAAYYAASDTDKHARRALWAAPWAPPPLFSALSRRRSRESGSASISYSRCDRHATINRHRRTPIRPPYTYRRRMLSKNCSCRYRKYGSHCERAATARRSLRTAHNL